MNSPNSSQDNNSHKGKDPTLTTDAVVGKQPAEVIKTAITRKDNNLTNSEHDLLPDNLVHQQEKQLAKSNKDCLHQSTAEMARKAAKQHKKWNKRLKIFFCCLGYKKNKDSIADVASIFAEFYADLKVPSSDIAAGFVLLSKYQAAQREWIVKNGHDQQLGVEQYLSGIPITSSTKFLDLTTAEDSHLVNDLIYYLNYSLAIFGWPMHLVDDPCLLCCIYPYLKLSPCCSSSAAAAAAKGQRHCKDDDDARCKKQTKNRDKKKKSKEQQVATSEATESETEKDKLNCDETSRNETKTTTSRVGELDENCDMPIILEDNCCSCNVASAERRLVSHNYEIIYVNYKVNVNVVPFLVAADHSKQAIVVAIRGSMSLSDMVTDMNGQIDQVPLEDCPEDWLCHRGITRAAMYVKLTLERERIIERAKSCRPDLGSQNYTLVLCGHSLGAGAAAILGILMRPRYPNLKAFLYSPPGGILSMPVVEYTKEFAIGVILGNDTVPRLGVAQLERLRYQTLLSVKTAHKSSGKILAKALCPSCCFGDNQVEFDPVQSLDLLHGTEGRSFEFSGSMIPFQSQPRVLYVPGRLVHVVKNYQFESKKGSSRTRRLWNGPIYQAIWTDNAIYDRVIISEGMFFDHLPNKLMQAMKMLFFKTLPARNDSRSSVSLESSQQQQQHLPLANNQEPVRQKEPIVRELNYDQIKQEEKEIDHDDNNNNNQSDGKAFPNLNDVLKESNKLQSIEIARRGDINESSPVIIEAAADRNKINLDENGNEQF